MADQPKQTQQTCLMALKTRLTSSTSTRNVQFAFGPWHHCHCFCCCSSRGLSACWYLISQLRCNTLSLSRDEWLGLCRLVKRHWTVSFISPFITPTSSVCTIRYACVMTLSYISVTVCPLGAFWNAGQALASSSMEHQIWLYIDDTCRRGKCLSLSTLCCCYCWSFWFCYSLKLSVMA